MENRWATPEGYEELPPLVSYRILDQQSGQVVRRQTSVARDIIRARYYHALSPADQHFADEIVNLVQQACAYFYAADQDYEPLEGVAEIRLTDEQVSARIARLDQGENTREAKRDMKAGYPLGELPFEQQRALVEQIEALKQRWQFEILGEVEQIEA